MNGWALQTTLSSTEWEARWLFSNVFLFILLMGWSFGKLNLISSDLLQFAYTISPIQLALFDLKIYALQVGVHNLLLGPVLRLIFQPSRKTFLIARIKLLRQKLFSRLRQQCYCVSTQERQYDEEDSIVEIYHEIYCVIILRGRRRGGRRQKKFPINKLLARHRHWHRENLSRLGSGHKLETELFKWQKSSPFLLFTSTPPRDNRKCCIGSEMCHRKCRLGTPAPPP